MNPTVASYEPPISTHPFPIRAWHQTTQLAPGVQGHTFECGGAIVIHLIVAEREGSGDVGRFLDRLSKRCIIMSVTSQRLKGMLLRRGYQMVEVDGDDFWRRE